MSIQKIFFCLYVCLFESLAGLLGTMVGPLDNEAHIEQAQAREIALTCWPTSYVRAPMI